MKTTYVQKLYRNYIQNEISSLGFRGKLLYLKPVDFLLRGFYFESSGFSGNSFNIEVFVQPLYIMHDSIVFHFGDTLNHMGKGYDHWWSIDEENEKSIMGDVVSLMKSSAIPFLNNNDCIESFIDTIKNFVDVSTDIYGMRTLSYSYIIIREYKRATDMLDYLIATLDVGYKENERKYWLLDWKNQAYELQNLLRQSSDEAINLLRQWRRSTLSSVHLDLEI